METFDPEFLSKMPKLDEEGMNAKELLYDPLKIIISINSTSAPLTEELLYGMWYWLRRSRTFWYGQMARKLPSETPSRAINEKISGMLQRQELIYLKALLDHLSAKDMECNESIYIFINQAMVDSPGLIKEVHRSEFLYDVKLVPRLVQKVPAMHAAVEAAHALTGSEYLEDKEHGELLLAYLALQYPSPKTLNYAKLVLKSIISTPHTLRILIIISLAFPDLISECRALLLDDVEQMNTFDVAVQQVKPCLQLPIYYPPKAPDQLYSGK